MKEALGAYINLSDAAYASLRQSASFQKAPKGRRLLQAGAIQQKLFFLESGLMRAYRLIDGKEYTHYFFVEQWFVTDFKSYLSERAGELYVEALTDVTYYEFQKAPLLQLYTQYHELEALGRIIAEQAYLKMVERLVDFQTQPLKERYHQLIDQQPDLFREVPQKYIASYLGVAEQSLSRIKSHKV